MNHEFVDALEELEKDRGIDKEILIDTIEQALLTAIKRTLDRLKMLEYILIEKKEM